MKAIGIAREPIAAQPERASITSCATAMPQARKESESEGLPNGVRRPVHDLV